MWEEELNKKWHLHNYQESDGSCIDCDKGVIDFIKSLLKEQRAICCEAYTDSSGYADDIVDDILDAPEPTGRDKE